MTINAVAILGPPVDTHISGSFHLLNGSMKAVPDIPLNIVDVRDVADLHIRAMLIPEAGGQRFIASSDGQISLRVEKVSGDVGITELLPSGDQLKDCLNCSGL
ncbi:Rossmann-fold NAD(P)-binding domain-containing protein [Pararcticibacter amylolyticus]|uniref:hypothetical protein n=1 Tax=Pararcticibacter amylolyticus TaxID=2173175 RepID=UPI00192E6246|nr:hypothetical protein [Pararcticibacter amylolyticus]